MKSLTPTILLACSLAFPAAAQITITNAVFPVVGDTLHYAFGNQPEAINRIFTPPGGPQQWDLGELQADAYWDVPILDPQSAASSGSFPEASIFFLPLNPTGEAFRQVTANAVLDLGYQGLDELGLGLDLLFRKSPALEESWAPVDFFDIRQSTSNVLTGFDASVAPAILLNLVPTADSFRIRLTYQRVGAIDAFGTLAIPGGMFDVLRKKQTEYQTSAVDVKVQPLGWIDISTIGGQQVLPLGTDTIVTYHFLNDASKEAIAICRLNTAQNEVTSVQYKAISPATASREPTAGAVITAFPNPLQETLHVQAESKASGLGRIHLINSQGRLVLDHDVEILAGANSFSLPVAQLPSGIYALTLSLQGETLGSARVVKL